MAEMPKGKIGGPRRHLPAHDPDGVFLSNGPGDPEPLGYAQEAIRRGHRPPRSMVFCRQKRSPIQRTHPS